MSTENQTKNELAREILGNWKETKGKLSNENPYRECVDQINDLFVNEGHNLNDQEAEQVAEFIIDCPTDMRLELWSLLQKSMDNLVKIHSCVYEMYKERNSKESL